MINISKNGNKMKNIWNIIYKNNVQKNIIDIQKKHIFNKLDKKQKIKH